MASQSHLPNRYQNGRRIRFRWGDQVRRDSELSATAKVLAWEMKSYASAEEMACLASRSTRVDESTIRRMIKQLEQAGWISRKIGHGRGNWKEFRLISAAGKGCAIASHISNEWGANPTRKDGKPAGSHIREPHEQLQDVCAGASAARFSVISVRADPDKLETWRSWLLEAGSIVRMRPSH